ncbi:MAG: UvrD-helicase domain-containing protein [Planctomycetes bacterium]|nr:UvrD-helicase domain-containing protein [Planctomycetota bacterium]
MSAAHHELWLASAGTGKTFRLTNRFLALLFAGAEPERILATTFTRKAAGEILDRVLERLVEAVESDDGLAALRSALGDDALDEVRCRGLLARLTRALDTFQVRTLDAFFVHLVRLFALDLDLPPDWSIADEHEGEALRAGAIQDVLAEGDPAELLALLRDLQRGGGKRAVQAALLDHAARLRPIALEASAGAWEAVAAPARDEAALERAVQALRAAELPRNKKEEPDGRYVKALAKLLGAVEAGHWDAVYEDTLTRNAEGEEPAYYKVAMPPQLVEALRATRALAGGEVLRQLVARNEAVHSLLDSFERAYERREHVAARFGFDDLPLALAPGATRGALFDEREAELWFRLDGRIDHLLLDEFQDTSPIQWRVLQPLASEITSSGGEERSFFCVGDVKQSIYGFRQAEPRLLAELEQLLPGLHAQTMETSWRSSPVVLDAVNRVFGALATHPAFVGDDLAPQRAAAEAFARAWKDHDAARALPGAVHLVEAREPGEGERKEACCLARAVERVAAIHAECPDAEIGVLVRTNKQIPLLIHRLRRLGIDASGEGGNELTDSEAVLVYLSLLHLADHPEDRAAAFHVSTSRLAAALELEPGRGALRATARRVRRALVEEGLGAFTARLGRAVQADAGWSAWDQARFAQLVDLALGFDARLGLRASEFVDHVRAHRVEAPGGARVRVMTIHGSKGLEFDAVVLPELYAPLVGLRDGYLTRRPRPDGPIDAVTVRPRAAQLELAPLLAELYHAATTRAVGDALCNLYVAMTRAKRRLDLVVPWEDPAKDLAGRAPTYARVVRGALTDDEAGAADDAGVLWSRASAEPWHAGLVEALPTPSEPLPPLRLAPTTAPRALARRAASAEEGGGRVRAGDLLASRAGASVGTLVHAALEGCEWLEAFAFDPAAVGAPGDAPELVESARALLERALAAPEVRAALARASCAAPAGSAPEVHREYAFSLLLDGPDGPAHWRGAIDRLVLARRDGAVVWAEVLDYKSDRVEVGELDAKVAYYRPQLEAYARVVAAQTGLAPEAVRLRLAFLSLGRVVDL